MVLCICVVDTPSTRVVLTHSNRWLQLVLLVFLRSPNFLQPRLTHRIQYSNSWRLFGSRLRVIRVLTKMASVEPTASHTLGFMQSMHTQSTGNAPTTTSVQHSSHTHHPTPSTRPSSAPLPELSAFISFLRSKSIKCVVFDMDRTLVTSHSGGCVAASQVNQFAESLTSTSRRLIPLLIQEGFHVAVATFADDLYSTFHREQVAGVELVQMVLKELPCFKSKDELAKVPIVTINPDLYYDPMVNNSQHFSEEQQRMKAASSGSSTSSAAPPSQLQNFFTAKLNQFGLDSSHRHWERCSLFPPLSFKNHHLLLISSKLDLAMNELMLIDDRDENVHAAIEAGAWGVFLERKKGLLLTDLAERNIKGPAKTK